MLHCTALHPALTSPFTLPFPPPTTSHQPHPIPVSLVSPLRQYPTHPRHLYHCPLSTRTSHPHPPSSHPCSSRSSMSEIRRKLVIVSVMDVFPFPTCSPHPSIHPVPLHHLARGGRADERYTASSHHHRARSFIHATTQRACPQSQLHLPPHAPPHTAIDPVYDATVSSLARSHLAHPIPSPIPPFLPWCPPPPLSCPSCANPAFNNPPGVPASKPRQAMGGRYTEEGDLTDHFHPYLCLRPPLPSVCCHRATPNPNLSPPPNTREITAVPFLHPRSSSFTNRPSTHTTTNKPTNAPPQPPDDTTRRLVTVHAARPVF